MLVNLMVKNAGYSSVSAERRFYSGVMRMGSQQSCQNGDGLPIQVHGDRSLFVQKLSPNQPVYIDVAQERSQVF